MCMLFRGWGGFSNSECFSKLVCFSTLVYVEAKLDMVFCLYIVCLVFQSIKSLSVQVCFICKQKLNLLRCVRCTVAFHNKCAPWPEAVIRLEDHPGQAVCWRHSDWRLDKKVNFLYSPELFTVIVYWLYCKLQCVIPLHSLSYSNAVIYSVWNV